MGNRQSDIINREPTDLNFTEDINTMATNLRLENNDNEFTEDLLHSVLSKYVKRTDAETQILNEPATLSEVDTAASPFITTDIYNYLQNKALKGEPIEGQAGGAANKRRMTDLNEDSSTSSTSSTGDVSSSDDISSSSNSSEKKHKKKSRHHKSKHSTVSENNLSYLSSSAHTGGEFSDTNNSVPNENHKQSLGQDSINTSDINMVSEY